MDGYDRYKLETPEEEDERINGRARRTAARLEWMADHADELLEEQRDRERQSKHDNGN